MKLNGGMMSSTLKDIDLILSLTELNDVNCRFHIICLSSMKDLKQSIMKIGWHS